MKVIDDTEQDNKAENWAIYQQVSNFLKQETFWTIKQRIELCTNRSLIFEKRKNFGLL